MDGTKFHLDGPGPSRALDPLPDAAWDARPSRVRPAVGGRSSKSGLDAREVFSGKRQMCIRLESSAKNALVRKTISAAITRNAATVQTNAGIRTWIAPQAIKINGMRL